MADTVKEAKLQNPTARRRLKAGRQPPWNTIVASRDHLGWQRWPEDASGRWLLRRRGGNYTHEHLGIANDCQEADGVSILDYQQARAKAVELSMDEARPAGRITVQRVVADYIDMCAATGKNTATAESSAVCWILPKLGNHEVAGLTSAQLRHWVAWMVEARDSESPLADEQLRRRRVSANRHLSVLKAALNHAFDEGRVSSNAAWGRRVKKFRGVQSTRARYLTIEECRRFLAGRDATFYPLARAALETGARYSELARLEVADFNKASGTLLIRKSKTAKARHVILTAEGTTFFSDACAGRSPQELMFTRKNGAKWRHGNQGRYIGLANKRAGIDPPISFHGLRHAYCSLCVMNNVPLVVLAKNLGHANVRMIESTYGHLAPSYISEAIRAGAPRFM
jgi:integrase